MSAYQRIREFLFPKSIATKLAEACASVSNLKKLGDNGQFTYLRIVDIADALRDELFSRGIVIISSDVECHEKVFPSSNPDRPYTEIRVRTEFTVSCGPKALVFSAYGTGRDMDGKALFAAQTGALKSWLKRLGLIFGERDDPEVEAKKEPKAEEELPKAALAQKRYQARAWAEAMSLCGKSEKEVEALLSEAMGKAVTSGQIIALPHRDFDVAMRILTRHGDLTDIAAKSVEAAKRGRGRGPQPIVAALEQQADEMTGD